MSKTRLLRHQPLTPDHVCPTLSPERGICWHVYGRRDDGSRIAVAARSESSFGAQLQVREEIDGVFFERIVPGMLDRSGTEPAATPAADYR